MRTFSARRRRRRRARAIRLWHWNQHVGGSLGGKDVRFLFRPEFSSDFFFLEESGKKGKEKKKRPGGGRWPALPPPLSLLPRRMEREWRRRQKPMRIGCTTPRHLRNSGRDLAVLARWCQIILFLSLSLYVVRISSSFLLPRSADSRAALCVRDAVVLP